MVQHNSQMGGLEVVREQAFRIRELESQLGYELDKADLLAVEVQDVRSQLAEETRQREEAEARLQVSCC